MPCGTTRSVLPSKCHESALGRGCNYVECLGGRPHGLPERPTCNNEGPRSPTVRQTCATDSGPRVRRRRPAIGAAVGDAGDARRYGSSLWAAAEPPGSAAFTSNAVAFLARASLRISVTTPGTSPAPRFISRLAWVFVWDGSAVCHSTGPGSFSPSPAASSKPARLVSDIELIAADGSGEGVAYRQRGRSDCGARSAPTAEVALYYESAPWTPVPSSTRAFTVRVSPRPCSDADGGNVAANTFRHVAVVMVSLTITMARRPCTQPASSRAVDFGALPAGTQPTHGPTGLLLGRTGPQAPSGEFRVTYFDGTTHTLTSTFTPS